MGPELLGALCINNIMGGVRGPVHTGRVEEERERERERERESERKRLIERESERGRDIEVERERGRREIDFEREKSSERVN